MAQFTLTGNVQNLCEINLTIDRSSLPSGQGNLYLKKTLSATSGVSSLTLTPESPTAYFFAEQSGLSLDAQYSAIPQRDISSKMGSSRFRVA